MPVKCLRPENTSMIVCIYNLNVRNLGARGLPLFPNPSMPIYTSHIVLIPYANATNTATRPVNLIPVTNSRLLPSLFPEPGNAEGLIEIPAVAVVLVVFEPVEVLGVLSEEPELELPDELEPSLELVPPRAPTDGEMLSGASFASAAYVMIVREAFLAGLRRKLISLSCLHRIVRHIRINNPNHAILTMISLGAIVPNGLRVIDHDGICRHFWRVWLDRHKARKKTWLLRLDIVDGYARVIKGGLNNGMVLLGVRRDRYDGEDIPLDKSETVPSIQPQLSDH